MKKRKMKKTVKKEKPILITDEWGLNPKQEQFCELYATSREFLGNGTQCYLEVYGSKDEFGNKISYETAKTNASRLLTNANAIKRINALLEAEGFTDENVDKQHLFLVNQHADLKTKLGAVKEYNILKKRVKAEGGDSPKELHLHLHRTEKVIQIVSKAEEELKKELEHELIQSVQKNGADDKEAGGENTEETGGDSSGADTGGGGEDESPELVQESYKQT